MGKRAGENREDGCGSQKAPADCGPAQLSVVPMTPGRTSQGSYHGSTTKHKHQVSFQGIFSDLPGKSRLRMLWQGNTQDLKAQVRKSYLQAKRVRDPSELSAQALLLSRDVCCASTLSSWKQINSNCDLVKACFSGESWHMPAASINKQRYLWTLNVSAIFSKHTHLLGDESQRSLLFNKKREIRREEIYEHHIQSITIKVKHSG